MTAEITIKDKEPIKLYIDALVIISQANPNNIFKSVCPDIILANNLIDKLKTLDK